MVRNYHQFTINKWLPQDWEGLIPIPSSVMMADVSTGTLNSSAANFTKAVTGASSGTDILKVEVKCYWLYLCKHLFYNKAKCQNWLTFKGFPLSQTL